MFIGSFKGRISFTNYSSTRSGHQNIRFTLINSKNFTLLSTVLFILIFFHIKWQKIPIKYINLPLYTHSPNIRNQQFIQEPSSPNPASIPFYTLMLQNLNTINRQNPLSTGQRCLWLPGQVAQTAAFLLVNFNWNFNKDFTTLERTAFSTALTLLIKFFGDRPWE